MFEPYQIFEGLISHFDYDFALYFIDEKLAYM